MLFYLCMIWILLAALDAGHTVWMLTKHGIEIELNGAIRKLCSWWGAAKGSVIGVFIPTCAIAGLCWMLHLEKLMLALVAARLILAAYQIRYHFKHAD